MEMLFNSTFENSLRLLILLDEYDLPKTPRFGVTDRNLNGNNEYKFSVFASHRESVKEALKELVLNGTVLAVSYNHGLSYIISPEGEDFCGSLESDYAKEYRKNVKAVIKAVGNRSERTLISDVYEA